MNKKITNAIGLAYVSKNVMLGTDLIIQAMRNNNVGLVIISTKAGYNTQKLIMDKSAFYNVEVLIVDETDASILPNALGGRNVVVLAIKKSGFKEMIVKAIKGE